MTEHDILARATKALREAQDGESAGAPFTRARVMRSLHEEKKRRLSRTLLVGPLAAILIGGTAWAAATGQLPELLERAERWIVSVQAPTLPATAVPELEAKRTPRAGPSVSAPAPVEEPAPEETVEPEPVEPEPVEPEPVDSVPEASERRPRPRREPALPTPSTIEPAVEPPVEPAAETPRDPELAAFRRAHDLDFRASQPSAAIAAYRDYLAQYPGGRFVPEARYNTALNLLELGQRERARSLLEPFARGRFGAYRQSEAQSLLDALDGKGGASDGTR